MPRLIVDLNFDPPKLITEYTESDKMGQDRERRGASSAKKARKEASNGEATEVAADAPEAARDPLEAGDDIIAYAKGLTLPEIKAFCGTNKLEVTLDGAPNGGVAKMRAMNAIRSALKAGKVLHK